jgi:Family of unknown function (DUF6186)
MATRVITIIGFCAVIAALVVLEIVGRRPGSRVPTLGEWLGYLMRQKTGRVLLLAGWLWLGWHYFSR